MTESRALDVQQGAGMKILPAENLSVKVSSVASMIAVVLTIVMGYFFADLQASQDDVDQRIESNTKHISTLITKEAVSADRQKRIEEDLKTTTETGTKNRELLIRIGERLGVRGEKDEN